MSNLLWVVQARPDHICQDRFCRDRPGPGSLRGPIWGGGRTSDLVCRSRYWLGVPLFGTYQCPECGRDADVMGDHKIDCSGNGDRIAHHNNLRDVLFNAAQSAALGPRKEALGLVPNSGARPADILLPNWSHGRQAALDVAVISPLQQLTVAEAAVTPGHALEVCISRKLSANLPSCRAAGVECVPIRIGDFLGQRSDPSPTLVTKHLLAV